MQLLGQNLIFTCEDKKVSRQFGGGYYDLFVDQNLRVRTRMKTEERHLHLKRKTEERCRIKTTRREQLQNRNESL